MVHRHVCLIVTLGVLVGAPPAKQESLSVLDRHEQREKVADEHYRIGLYFMEEGLRTTAIGHLEYCVAINPRHTEAYRHLGYLYYLRGAAPELRSTADYYFSRLLELEPGNLFGRIYRGTVRTALGQFDGAEADARAGLAIEPENEVLLMLLGNALLRQLRFAEAAKVYREAAAQRPDNPWAKWCLALATERSGQELSGLPEKLRIAYPRQDDAPAPARFTNLAPRLGIDTLSRGRGVAWTDFNKDGLYDLFAVGIRDPHTLYRNNGDGTFTDHTDPSGLEDPRGGWAALAADYDNDGDPDLYVTRNGWAGREGNSLYLNDGSGKFLDVAAQIGVDCPADSFTAAYADYDKDGFLDLYVANGVSLRQGSPNVLYRNLGNGRFQDVSLAARVANPGSSVGTTWGDYNGDGYPDLYVTNYGGDNALYRNRGDGTFEDVTIASGTAGPRYSFITFFFDYNNDQRLDLFIASWTQDFAEVIQSRGESGDLDPERRLALLRNNGDGTFTDVTAEAGLARNSGAMSAGYFDLDNDGYLDILVGNGGPTMDRYEPDVGFHNQADGTFLEISRSAGLANIGKTHGIAGHDFDRDGYIDVYTAVGGQEIGDRQANGFFRNQGGKNHWLTIRLVGTESNRDAVGAKVTVWTKGQLRFQEVAIGTGFGCTNSLPLEFGLGAYTEANRVEIVWPAGGKQTLLDVSADQFIVVTEGEEEYRKETR